MQTDEPTSPVTSSLQSVAAKGMAWTGLAHLITYVLTLITNIVLARFFLLPSEFGLVSMAGVFIGLAGIVNELGLGLAIIQKPKIEDRHLNTVFVTNGILGLLICLLLIIASPVIAAFYANPDVQPVVAVLAIGFLIRGTGAVHNAILLKSMNFRSIALIGLASTLVQTSTAILLASRQLGSWALVYGYLAGSIIMVLGLWIAVDWRPRLQFDRLAFKELFSFGAPVLGSSVLGYASSNVDNLMIGRSLGATSLGYYDVAYRWATLPRQRLVGMIHHVMFPSFSVVQDDEARLKSGYLALVSYISFITFPAAVGLIIIAPTLIPLLYTERWTPAIVPLQILSISGLISTIGSPMGLVLKAKGRADLEFKMMLFSIIVLTGLLLVGLQFGLVGVAIAVSLKSFIMVWVIGLKTNRLIHLKFSTYIRAFIPATQATLIMAVLLLLIQRLFGSIVELSDLGQIIAFVIGGIAIYIAAIKLLNPPQWSELVKLIMKMAPKFPYSNKILPLVEQILS